MTVPAPAVPKVNAAVVSNAAATTYVPCSGTVSASSVVLAGSYVVSCNITVPTGDTLTIDPGAVLKFGPDNNITVQGTLNAVGTPSDPVTFTTVNDNSVGGTTGTGNPLPGSWYGISGNASNGINLQYAHLDYAYFGLNCVGSTGLQGPYDVTDDTFRSLEGSAVACFYDNSTSSPLTIENDVAVNVGDAANPVFYVYSSTVSPGLLSGNTASGGYPFFDLNSDIVNSGSMPTGGPTWIFQGVNVVDGGQSLTLPVGSVLKFASAGILKIQGSLTAVGTASSPIVLTSVNDSIGGASGTGQPASGDWWGIQAQNGVSSFNLEYAHVSFATIGVTCGGAGGSTVTHSVFTSISGPAVYSTSNTASTVEDNTAVGAGNASQPAYDFNGGVMSPQMVAGNSASGGYPYFAIDGVSFSSGTLPLGGPTWIMEGGSSIPTGQLLTLSPGTLLKFGSGANITVVGGLKAVGTSKDPIRFTSVDDNTVGGATGTGKPVAGDWSGVNTNVPSTFDLQYTQLEYPNTGVTCIGSVSPFTISHDTFDSVLGSAVSCIYSNASKTDPVPLTIEDNTAQFAGTASNPAFYIYSSTISPKSLGGNSATGGYPFFVLHSDTIDTGILPTGGPTWIIDGITNVAAGQTLTLPKGSVLKFGSGGQLVVWGKLKAVGTASSPIVFTSVNDSSIGGSTGTGVPASGDWYGIVVEPFEYANFKDDVFEYATDGIRVIQLDAVDVTHSVFSYDVAAIEVDSTADNDPALGLLPGCQFPYLSVVLAATDYFGASGVPYPDLDMSSIVGDIADVGGEYLPDFTELFGTVGALGTMASAELGAPKGNTVSWAIASCPDLTGGVPIGVPVTPVIVNPLKPPYPLKSKVFEQ